MLSDSQKELLVNRVNREHDLPILSEGTEGHLLMRMADKINPALESALRDLIPDDYVDVIKLALAEHLVTAERRAQIAEILVRRLRDPLVDAVNAKVDLKFLPENVEQELLRRMLTRGIEEVVELVVGEVDQRLRELLSASRETQ
mmetsp:Transcript_55912/g.137356  ORF Transcript_55912/g.137356 Transcript_55912/m.137356 type:complete len:145 (-) Transcript_55912:1863-2297(-)